MSSSQSGNTTTIIPGYAFDGDSNRDASDWTRQLKQRRVYNSYTSSTPGNKNTTNPWLKYGNQFRLTYVFGKQLRITNTFGRISCGLCNGNAFTNAVVGGA